MTKMSTRCLGSLGGVLLWGLWGLLSGCGDDGGTAIVTPPEPTPAPTVTPGPDPNPPTADVPVVDITSPTLIFVPFVVVAGNELSVTTTLSAPAGLGESILVEVTGPSSFSFTLAPEDIGCVTGGTIFCNSTRVEVLPETTPLGNYDVEVTISDVLGQGATTGFSVEVVESGEVPPRVQITDPPEPITLAALSPLTFSASILPPDGLASPFSIFVEGEATTGETLFLSTAIFPETVNCQEGSVELCNALFADLFAGQIPAGEYTLTLLAVDQLNSTGSDVVTLIAQ